MGSVMNAVRTSRDIKDIRISDRNFGERLISSYRIIREREFGEPDLTFLMLYQSSENENKDKNIKHIYFKNYYNSINYIYYNINFLLRLNLLNSHYPGTSIYMAESAQKKHISEMQGISMMRVASTKQGNNAVRSVSEMDSPSVIHNIPMMHGVSEISDVSAAVDNIPMVHNESAVRDEWRTDREYKTVIESLFSNSSFVYSIKRLFENQELLEANKLLKTRIQTQTLANLSKVSNLHEADNLLRTRTRLNISKLMGRRESIESDKELERSEFTEVSRVFKAKEGFGEEKESSASGVISKTVRRTVDFVADKLWNILQRHEREAGGIYALAEEKGRAAERSLLTDHYQRRFKAADRGSEEIEEFSVSRVGMLLREQTSLNIGEVEAEMREKLQSMRNLLLGRITEKQTKERYEGQKIIKQPVYRRSSWEADIPGIAAKYGSAAASSIKKPLAPSKHISEMQDISMTRGASTKQGNLAVRGVFETDMSPSMSDVPMVHSVSETDGTSAIRDIPMVHGASEKGSSSAKQGNLVARGISEPNVAMSMRDISTVHGVSEISDVSAAVDNIPMVHNESAVRDGRRADGEYKTITEPSISDSSSVYSIRKMLEAKELLEANKLLKTRIHTQTLANLSKVSNLHEADNLLKMEKRLSSDKLLKSIKTVYRQQTKRSPQMISHMQHVRHQDGIMDNRIRNGSLILNNAERKMMNQKTVAWNKGVETGEIGYVDLTYRNNQHNAEVRHSTPRHKDDNVGIIFETEKSSPEFNVINETSEKSVDLNMAETQGATIDIAKIANQVYKKLEDRLRIERQRRGLFR